MDGDLRYISLQYIKGDNYEEITCFKYEEIVALLCKGDADQLKIKLISNPYILLDDLIDTKEEINCKIGESFLNDLVNYYNFKDIMRLLTKAKKSIVEIAYDDKKNNDKDTTLIITLEKLRSSIYNLPEFSIYMKITKNYIADIINTLIILKNSEDVEYDENDVNKEDKERLLVKLKAEIQPIMDKFKIDGDVSNNRLKSAAIYIGKKVVGETTEDLERYANFKKKIKEFEEKNLSELYDLLLKKNPNDLKKKKEVLNELTRLFNTYIKYCKINIEKYEKLFKYNEISNIDDAFMIESYSKFLKKLKKLKENLESKDTGKLKRLLVNSFNKLFHKYGIDPNKTLEDKDLAYISSLILQ
jgi:hypothetical protein